MAHKRLKTTDTDKLVKKKSSPAQRSLQRIGFQSYLLAGPAHKAPLRQPGGHWASPAQGVTPTQGCHWTTQVSCSRNGQVRPIWANVGAWKGGKVAGRCNGAEGGLREDGPVGRQARRRGECRSGEILTSVPRLIGPNPAAQIYASDFSDFTGAVPKSPIRLAIKYFLTPR